MQANKIENVVIVGGGTAGWITAALLAKVLGKQLNIRLIESSKINTIGVGEATIPAIVNFNQALGLDEQAMMKACKSTIKLGIEFENWQQQGHKYMHAFGGLGKDLPFCDFHHLWLRYQKHQPNCDFWDFSLNYQAAKNNKFARLKPITGTNFAGLPYAYHFDAGLYAKFLQKFSENLGVKHQDATVEQVHLSAETGLVEQLQLTDGSFISGDLFIDCTGMAGLLIEKALNTGFEDWSHWLPCDRAIAVASESQHPISPYTRSIAHQAGWQWRIPLQHRTGNGLVYASKYLSDEQAKKTLLSQLNGKPLTEPRVIPFRTGRRLKQWHKNVICIGLSSGFLEPLESTSIHLIQTAAIRLLKLFPHQGIKSSEVAEYNRQSKREYEQIRDFIILHYKLTQRDDSDFWRHCQGMEIPQSLANKMQLFKETGKIFREQDELFSEVAWQQVLIGQGLQPESYHPMADSLSTAQLNELMNNLTTLVNSTVKQLPSHENLLQHIR